MMFSKKVQEMVLTAAIEAERGASAPSIVDELEKLQKPKRESDVLEAKVRELRPGIQLTIADIEGA